MPEPTVSVLMPVHAGVRPDHLAAALDSVAAQTRAPDQVVVVVDGPVPPAHEAVLAAHPDLVRVVLPASLGAGPALAAGLAVCTGEYVARADSDDVNEPRRLAVQLALLASSGADVCSAAMTEVAGDPPVAVGVRGTPLAHDHVARRMRTTNPVNHPTAVFRREAAVTAGGYQRLPFLEDYDLWARMLAAGAQFVGTAEPLVLFRADGLHDRRTAPGVGAAERELQRRLVAYGVIGAPRARLNLVLRGAYRRLPRPLLEAAYGVLFRRR